MVGIPNEIRTEILSAPLKTETFLQQGCEWFVTSLWITLGAFLQSNSMKTWSRENFLWNPCSQPRFSKLATKPANQSRLLNGTFCVFCDYLNVLPLKFYVKVCSKQFAATKWDQLTMLRVSKISFRVVQSTTVLRMYSHLPEGRKGFKCLAKSDWILFLSSWHVCEWVLGGKFFSRFYFRVHELLSTFVSFGSLTRREQKILNHMPSTIVCEKIEKMKFIFFN